MYSYDAGEVTGYVFSEYDEVGRIIQKSEYTNGARIEFFTYEYIDELKIGDKMADWITHLHCAHKANEVFKYEGEKAEMFFYGNILPDINPGWNIEPKVKILQDQTHFAQAGPSYYWAHQRFYEKYEKKIKEGNPLFVGYLFHLWLDIGVMTEYVKKVPLEDFIIKGMDVREQKWKDMNVYIKPYTYKLTTDNLSTVVRESKNIEEVDICEEDLRKAAAYLPILSSENKEIEYVYFDENTLREFYDRTSVQFAAFIGDGSNVTRSVTL